MIPGVSFNYMMSGISGQHRSKASRSMDYELESLRSVASKRRTSRASGSDGVTATEEDYPEPPQWEALVPGVATPKIFAAFSTTGPGGHKSFCFRGGGCQAEDHLAVDATSAEQSV